MDFPKTDEGEQLVDKFRREVAGFSEQYLRWQVREWCEWCVLKWGWDGAVDMADRIISYARAKARRVPNYLTYLMGPKRETFWMPDEEYRDFKRKHPDFLFRYREFKREHIPGVEVTISEVIDSLREPDGLVPPSRQGVEW